MLWVFLLWLLDYLEICFRPMIFACFILLNIFYRAYYSCMISSCCKLYRSTFKVLLWNIYLLQRDYMRGCRSRRCFLLLLLCLCRHHKFHLIGITFRSDPSKRFRFQVNRLLKYAFFIWLYLKSSNFCSLFWGLIL